MTIVHKSENTHRNSDGLSIWELPNIPDNHSYVHANEEPKITIEGINITDVGTEFFQEVGKSYKQDKNCIIIISLLKKYCKDTVLANSLDDIWKTYYDNGRFHLFDGIVYHTPKKTCVVVLCRRMLINTILIEFHDQIYSGILSENRKMERINTYAW
ncbi:hypothetical protein O181_051989 [Austropuccinia psidii MF-1]|uniref:Uncharacterized protein n=1 Tax=Austropuccinia psidii MF-1 TaxID=1389203 RepID=A0A9Q3HR86_9BASI|nr:hypothetical protein [Austropuccinia psidii MF-1]